MKDAACRNGPLPTSAFFPGQHNPHEVDRAKKVCGPCPVQVACLEFALDHSFGGVWGNTSERERRRMRARRSVA